MNLRSSSAVAALSLLLATPALAFKPEGHGELEAIAYDELADTPEGRELLKTLLIAHVLLRAPETNAPLVGSGGPDQSLERQFDTRNQAFHFMAENGDVMAAARSSNPKRVLLERALPKNLRLMRTLFDETVENPVGAYQAGRGFYVLLHVVGDSFSREHAERNPRNQLVTIKGWRLLWPWWPSSATEPQEDGTLPLLHHAVSGGADLDWRDISHGYLRPEGRAAVEAMKSLLWTIYKARRTLGTEEGKAEREWLWAAFIEQHFNNEACPLTDGKPSCAAGEPLAGLELRERMPLTTADAFPSWQVSLGAGHRFAGGPDSQFLQLMVEGHRVPGAATGFQSRLLWGAGVTVRAQVSGLPQEPDRPFWRGGEAVLQGGPSFVLPYVQWLGVSVGVGARGGALGGELGGAASISFDLYARRYVGVKLRYEHDWWSLSGHANLISLSFSGFTTAAREITPVSELDPRAEMTTSLSTP